MIYTTFNLLREHGACESGYRRLAKSLGGIDTYGRDTPIPLTAVLDSNGLDDALWCLRATTEPCDKFARLLAVGFALEVQHLMTDPRSLAALDVAERYANGQATDAERYANGQATDAELAAAQEAAWDAVSAALDAASAARDAAAAQTARAAWAAAAAAAWAAASAAARAAASAAARDAMLARQATIMHEMLEAQ
jgi:hypothetical protein